MSFLDNEKEVVRYTRDCAGYWKAYWNGYDFNGKPFDQKYSKDTLEESFNLCRSRVNDFTNGTVTEEIYNINYDTMKNSVEFRKIDDYHWSATYKDRVIYNEHFTLSNLIDYVRRHYTYGRVPELYFFK